MNTPKNLDLIVTINKEAVCSCCGLCSTICPEVFSTSSGTVVIISQPNSGMRDAVELAKNSCPNNCIITQWK